MLNSNSKTTATVIILGLVLAIYGMLLSGCHTKQPAPDSSASSSAAVAPAQQQAEFSIGPIMQALQQLPRETALEGHFSESSRILRDRKETPDGDSIIHYRKVAKDLASATSALLLARPDVAATVYPGAVLWWDAANRGSFDPIIAEPHREFDVIVTGGTLARDGTSVSGFRTNGSATAFQSALSTTEILSNANNLDYRVIEARSLREAMLKLGLSTSYLGIARGGVEFDEKLEEKRASYVLALTQVYFTASVDPGSMPEGGPLAFRRIMNANAMARDISHRKSEIAYVSDVSYGRMVLLMVTSDASRSELSQAVNASASFFVSTTGNIDRRHRDILNRSEIRCVIVGSGATEDSGRVLSADFSTIAKEVRSFLETSHSLDSLRHAVPISLTLRFARDNATAYVGETLNYAYWEPFRRVEPGRIQTYDLGTIRVGPPVLLLAGDGEISSGRSTAHITVAYKPAVDASGRGITLHVRYRAQETDGNCRERRDTLIGADRIFDFPNIVGPGHTISLADGRREVSRTECIRGVNHQAVLFPDFGQAREVRVDYDRRGREDHRHASCQFNLRLRYQVNERSVDIVP